MEKFEQFKTQKSTQNFFKGLPKEYRQNILKILSEIDEREKQEAGRTALGKFVSTGKTGPDLQLWLDKVNRFSR